MKILLIILCVLALIILGILLIGIRVSFAVKFGKETKVAVAVFGKELPQKGKVQKKLKFTTLKRTVEFLFSSKVGLWGRVSYLIKKVIVKKFRLNIIVASDDAAQTALLYGGVCSVLYPVVGFLETVMDFKEDNMKIVCDYESAQPDLDFYAEIKIRVIHLLIAVFKIIPEITKFLKEVNEDEQ